MHVVVTRKPERARGTFGEPHNIGPLYKLALADSDHDPRARYPPPNDAAASAPGPPAGAAASCLIM